MPPPSLPTTSLERTYYYQGELLQLADFIRDQRYFRDLVYYQNHQLFAPGVIQGLALSGQGSMSLVVAPGFAISGKGVPLYVVRNTQMTTTTQPTKGSYLAVLDYADNNTPEFQSSLKVNHTITENPKLILVENGMPVTGGGIILGTVDYADGKITNIDQTAAGGRQFSYLLLPTTPPLSTASRSAPAPAEGTGTTATSESKPSYEELVPTLLQSVRELTARVAELEKQLQARNEGK